MNATLGLTRELQNLAGTKAPATLLPGVLARLGLSDLYWRLESPAGPVFVARSSVGISRISRERSAREFERAYKEQFGRAVRPATTPAPASLRRWVAGKPAAEKPELDLRGLSEFERAVLTKALEIPRGQVRPYAWIAKEIGAPRAVRAAGSALAHNPIPILIPCHRVVRSDGQIGRYSLGGGRMKRTILEAEGAHPETIERLASRGVRFLGNEEKRYFCYPTCGGIEHLIRENRVEFHSEREAVAAGYKPCGDCRPAIAA